MLLVILNLLCVFLLITNLPGLPRKLDEFNRLIELQKILDNSNPGGGQEDY